MTSSSTATSGRGFAVGLGAIALSGLALRLSYTLVVRPHVPALSDATTYHLQANLLAAGHGLVRPYDFLAGRVRQSAEFPPLFPALIAAVSFVGVKSVTGQRLAMCVVGTGTIVVVGLLGRRVAGDAVGLVAAALAALHPMLFQSDASLMSETLYTLGVAGSVLLAYRAFDRPTVPRWIALGVAVGLTALTRGEGLLLLLLLVVPLAVWNRAGREGAKLAGAAVAATLAVLAPWSIRNAVTFDAFVPISNNIGGALNGANCPPVYYGEQKGLWLFSCYDRVHVAGVNEASDAHQYRDAGIDYARQHLGRVPRIAVIRFLRTWGVFRPGQQVDYETLEGRTHTWQTIGQRLDWVLVPIALVGAALLWRRSAPLWPLLVPLALVSLTTVLTYGNERFREAAEPTIVILASAAIVAAAGRLRTGSTGEMAVRN